MRHLAFAIEKIIEQNDDIALLYIFKSENSKTIFKSLHVDEKDDFITKRVMSLVINPLNKKLNITEK